MTTILLVGVAPAWRALFRDAALMAARKLEAGDRAAAESLMRLAAMVVAEGRA
jgi:hypothetical protein